MAGVNNRPAINQLLKASEEHRILRTGDDLYVISF
jgi:hypothetical protein